MSKQKSDLSRAFSEDGALKTHVGGQALLEGVMMRGKYNWAAAVRRPDGGVYTEEHELASGKKKNAWMSWPLVRGCVALVESLGLGYKALEVATEHAFDRFDMSYAMYLEEGVDPATASDEEKMRAAGYKPEDIEKELAALAEESAAGGSAVEERAEEAEAAAEPAGASDPGSANSAGDGTAPCEPAGDAASGGFVKPDESFYREMLIGSDEGVPASDAGGFSWERDFGNPDEMVDALGAQRSLEIVEEPDAAPRGGGSSAGKGDSEGSNFQDGLGKGVMTASMVFGLVLGVVLFIVAPAFVTNLIVGEYDSNFILWNIVDGVLRVAIFVFYIWLIGRMKEIKRMFSYHGAEHKTIHCYEHGLELTPENCRSFPRLHVRCGTAFLIMVMVLAIIVYTVIPVNALISAWGVPDGAPKLILVILVRIVFMPVIAGLSYEINVKWAGTHPDNPLVKVILWPGMQMQYLTTNEPDDSMLECAIASMKLVLEREEREKAEASA